MIDDHLRDLVYWIARNAERESRFLTPDPCWFVDAHELLGEIARITGLTSEQLDRWSVEANAEAEELGQK